VRLAVLALGILLLAFVDVIVLERIYKPLAAGYRIPWSEFQVRLPFLGKTTGMLWWHVAFVPLGLCLFMLAGAAGRDWRLALAGCVLFATGWEDLVYYAIQFQTAPSRLPWLDASPLVAWTRVFTRSTHVTYFGLLLAACVGGIVAGLVLGLHRARHDPRGRLPPENEPNSD